MELEDVYTGLVRDVSRHLSVVGRVTDQTSTVSYKNLFTRYLFTHLCTGDLGDEGSEFDYRTGSCGHSISSGPVGGNGPYQLLGPTGRNCGVR